MYAQDNILCQFGLINLSSVQQLISQPILIHFWWELYHSTAFTTIETANEIEEDLWIGDSGASSHLIGSQKGVFD